MSKDRYPLQALLDLRQQIKKEHEIVLSKAINRLAQAESDLKEAIKKTKEKELQLCEYQQKQSNVRQGLASLHQQSDLFVQRIRSELEQTKNDQKAAQESKLICEKVVLEAQQVLATANKNLKLIEQNRDTWKETRLKEEIKKAEQEIEDLIVSRPR